MADKPENPAPGEDVFTEEDLLPSSEDRTRRAAGSRRTMLDRGAVIVAVLACGLIAGGMIALGAAAAPEVFRLPDPLSGNTMGAAFSRFDSIAITCALVALGAELLRTVLALRSPAARAWLPRARRYLTILLALGTLYQGLYLSPAIMGAFQAGVRRNAGPEGVALENMHQRAELVGKISVTLAALVMALHILTLESPGRRAEEDDEDVLGPLPPGPASR